MLSKEKVKMVFSKVASQKDFADGPLADVYLDKLPEILKSKGIDPDSEEARLMDENYIDYVVPWYVDSIVTDELVEYLNKNLVKVPVVEFFKDGFSDFCIRSVLGSVQEHAGIGKPDLVPLVGDKRIVVLGYGESCGFGNVFSYDRDHNSHEFIYDYGGYVVALSEDGELLVYWENVFEYENGKAGNALKIRSLAADPSGFYLTLECLDDVVPEDFRDLY